MFFMWDLWDLGRSGLFSKFKMFKITHVSYGDDSLKLWIVMSKVSFFSLHELSSFIVISQLNKDCASLLMVTAFIPNEKWEKERLGYDLIRDLDC